MIISRTSPLMRLRKTAAETTPAERMTLSLLEEGPAGRDRVEATVFLFDAAHFYLPVDFFSLVQGGQAQAGQRGGGGAGGYTPAQRIREIAVTFHGPREGRGQGVARADGTEHFHARREGFDDGPFNGSHGAAAAERERDHLGSHGAYTGHCVQEVIAGDQGPVQQALGFVLIG